MNPTITAIIVDDEQDAREGLEYLINKEVPEIKILARSENAQNALELIMDTNPDVIFLDIQMPDKSGFWLADKLKKLNSVPEIIFITAFDEYAIEAVKHAAFDFLTKPVSPLLLKESVNRLKEGDYRNKIADKLKALEAYLNKRKIKFDTINGFIIVDPEEIIYCEADGNYSHLHLVTGKKVAVSCQLGNLEKKLPANNFIRVKRSSIINLKYLEKFNRKEKTVSLSGIIQNYELKVSPKGIRKLNAL